MLADLRFHLSWLLISPVLFQALARRGGTFPSPTDNSSGVIRQTSFDGPQDAMDWLHSTFET